MSFNENLKEAMYCKNITTVQLASFRSFRCFFIILSDDPVFNDSEIKLFCFLEQNAVICKGL